MLILLLLLLYKHLVEMAPTSTILARFLVRDVLKDTYRVDGFLSWRILHLLWEKNSYGSCVSNA